MKQQHYSKGIISIIFLFFIIHTFLCADSTHVIIPTPGPVKDVLTDLSETPLPVQKDDPTPTPLPSQMNGDVNMDNKIDIIDALLICQYYVGLNPEKFKNPAAADVNGDAKIDIIDALLVAQYYVGIIPGGEESDSFNKNTSTGIEG